MNFEETKENRITSLKHHIDNYYKYETLTVVKINKKHDMFEKQDICIVQTSPQINIIYKGLNCNFHYEDIWQTLC